MTDKRDPELQALFAASHQELGGDELVANVMARIQSEKRKSQMLKALLGVVAIGLLWLFSPYLLSLSSLMNQVLQAPVMGMSGSFATEFLFPLNSVGFLVVLALIMAHKFRKIVFG